MFDHLYLTAYLSSWTLVNLIAAVWCHIRSLKDSKVVPIPGHHQHTNTWTLPAQVNKTPPLMERKYGTNDFDNFFNMDGNKIHHDEIMETPISTYGNKANLSQNQSPRSNQIPTQSHEQEVDSTPRTRKEHRSQTMRREAQQKRTIVLADGQVVDCYKLVKRSKKKKNSATPIENEPHSSPSHQFNKASIFSRGQTQQKPAANTDGKQRYWNRYQKIALQDKDLSKAYQILVIYFRQLACFLLSGFLNEYLIVQYNLYIIICACFGLMVLLRFLDGWLVSLVYLQKSKSLVFASQGFFWLLILGGIVYLIIFSRELSDLLWLILYLPQIGFDLLFFDSFKCALKSFLSRKAQRAQKEAKQAPPELQVISVL